MEFITNVLLEFVPNLVFMVFVLAGVKLTLKEVPKKFYQIWAGALAVLFVFNLTGTDNTYKHTTGYDKQLDVKSIEMRTQHKNVEIRNITPQPKLTEEERSKKFDEMVDYKKKEK